jgi:hypothetical protein
MRIQTPGADISDGRMTGMELLSRAHVTQLGHHRVAGYVCVCERERERERERESPRHTTSTIVLLSKSTFSEHIL